MYGVPPDEVPVGRVHGSRVHPHQHPVVGDFWLGDVDQLQHIDGRSA
jgi:hypothetical protein